MPCIGLDAFNAVLSNKSVAGSFRSQVVAQWAAVRIDEPDAPVTYGSALIGAGQKMVDSGSLVSTASTKFYVRFGVKYDLNTGATAPATADVALQVAYDTCGQVVGASSAQLQSTSGTRFYEAATPWLPALHANKMMASMVVNSLTGDFQWRMAYRTADEFKENASAWSVDWEPTPGSPTNPDRVAVDVNTTLLAPALTNKMWVQYGIQYNLKTPFTIGQATVNAAVAVKKA
jgi:hypothetical protein